MDTRKYGYIKKENPYLIAILMATAILLVGQITLAIQTNQLYKASQLNLEDTYEASNYIIWGHN